MQQSLGCRVFEGNLTDHPVKGSANYILQAKSGPSPVFVNKVLLEHCHFYSLTCRLWVLSASTAELSSCNRGCVTHKASVCSGTMFERDLDTLRPEEQGQQGGLKPYLSRGTQMEWTPGCRGALLGGRQDGRDTGSVLGSESGSLVLPSHLPTALPCLWAFQAAGSTT